MVADLLKRLSTRLKMSQTYTNHCLRASFVTYATEAGLTDSEIMSVTGHRSADSLAAYRRILPDRRVRGQTAMVARMAGGTGTVLDPAPAAAADDDEVTVHCTVQQPASDDEKEGKAPAAGAIGTGLIPREPLRELLPNPTTNPPAQLPWPAAQMQQQPLL